MNVEIKKQSRLQEAFSKAKNRIEDLKLNIICKLPPRMVSQKMIDKLDKRLAELKYEQVKNNWRNVELRKAVDKIKGNP